MIDPNVISITGVHTQVEGNNVNNDSWLMEHLPGSPYTEPSGDATAESLQLPNTAGPGSSGATQFFPESPADSPQGCSRRC